MQWDADHLLKSSITLLNITCISIKLIDLKNYKKKDKWKRILFNGTIYYLSHKLGFFLSYNITHKNKL